MPFNTVTSTCQVQASCQLAVNFLGMAPAVSLFSAVGDTDSFLVKGFLSPFLWPTRCVVAACDESEMAVVKLHCVLPVYLAWRQYFVIDE